MKTLFILFFVFVFGISSAQTIFQLKGKIDNFNRPSTIYLLSAYGSQFDLVDSMKSLKGEVLFLSDTMPAPGVYRLFWDDSHFFDFVVNHEALIEFQADMLEPSGGVKIISSEENLLYYHFNDIDFKIDSLISLGDAIYEQNDKDSRKKLEELMAQINELSYKAMDDYYLMVKDHPNSLALKIFKGSMPPDYQNYLKSGGTPYETEYLFLKAHYFDNIDMSDSNLVRTSIIYDACSQYLIDFVQEKNAQNYKKASDFMLSRFAVNEVLFQYVFELLLNTFEASGYEEVFVYLFDTYGTSSHCEGTRPGEMEMKVLAIRELARGKTPPLLDGFDREGNAVSLSDTVYNDSPVLVMFWASWCSHCEEVMPEINKLYAQYKPKGLEILAFSLDTSEVEWTRGVLRQDMKMVQLSDLKGFEGENAIRWFVWGTPTFILLDRGRTIFSRPYTLSMLSRDLKMLLP